MFSAFCKTKQCIFSQSQGMANCPFLCARAWRIEHEVKGPRGCALGGIVTAGIEPRINNTMFTTNVVKQC